MRCEIGIKCLAIKKIMADLVVIAICQDGNLVTIKLDQSLAAVDIDSFQFKGPFRGKMFKLPVHVLTQGAGAAVIQS